MISTYDLYSTNFLLWIAGGIILLVVYSTQTTRRGFSIVDDWAKRNNLKLVSAKQRSFVPFFTPSKGQFFRIKVIDSTGTAKTGWLRFPEWNPGAKEIQVDWD